MDEQHPIPQQISAYQFHLVGDMTLKQFFEIAGGALVSLLIYSSNLPGLFKWPLVVAAFLLGVALAFLPIQDRPLEIWIISFLQSIYSPTLYSWKKNQPKLYFQPEETTPAAKTEQTPAEVVPVSNPVPPPAPQTVTPQVPLQETEPSPARLVENPPLPPLPTEVYDSPPEKDKVVEIPEIARPAIENQIHSATEVLPVDNKSPQIPTGEVIAPASGQVVAGAHQAQFSQASSPPTPPTKANVIVGQVLGPNSEIIENAILEIKDIDGRSVRALRSNKLGHFMIITPLADGQYEIITEKEGYDFDPVTVEAKGEIIPPIAITTKESAINHPAVDNLAGDIYKTV